MHGDYDHLGPELVSASPVHHFLVAEGYLEFRGTHERNSNTNIPFAGIFFSALQSFLASTCQCKDS